MIKDVFHEIPDYWEEPVKELIKDIEIILDVYKIPHKYFDIMQIKEKFGCLRFYWMWNWLELDSSECSMDNVKLSEDKIHGIINYYGHMCERIKTNE